MNQTSSAPTAKVISGTVGAALATIVVWVLKQFLGVDMPPGIELAFNVVFVAGVTVLAGYIKSPSPRDTIEGQP